MRTLFIIFLQTFSLILLSQSVKYDDYFKQERLRFDFYFTGNVDTFIITPKEYILEPYWSGSRVNILDTFLYDQMVLKVYDSISNKLVYSAGFSHLFKEWQTTAEAKLRSGSYVGSLIMPFPKNCIRLEIYDRNEKQEFVKIFSDYLAPNSVKIVRDQPLQVTVFNQYAQSTPQKSVDIAVLAEGYSKDDSMKFVKDFNRFKDVFFSWEPYDKYESLINLYGVLAFSQNSGTDNPNDSIWVNTVLNSSFNTFGSDRYLTIPDISRARDIAGSVPYDHIVIMINSDKYGGGGIYNEFACFTSDNELMSYLFHHEFGHSFAGLADEYYSSSVAYEEFINTSYEPPQTNITTMVNFNRKWAGMIADTIPIPTPDNEDYDDVVGVFEGASYQAKGIYRPMRDCTMKSKTKNNFCTVCKSIIEKMILFYSK